jgi:alpha-ketoglutarate-dependent taurine dioxygenase
MTAIAPTITADLTLEIVPLSGTIGAEIRGVDPKRPLDPDTVDAVRRALLRYRVVFFPGAHLSPAEHVAFAEHFGELTPAHPVIPGIDGFPEVFEIDYSAMWRLAASYGDVAKQNTRPGGGISWHTDVTFVERPPLGSILNAVIIPESGGDTMWSDQVAAYEALSEPIRSLLDGLTAVHDGAAQFGNYLAERPEGVDWEDGPYQHLTPVEHPVVRTHPETGERALFVNPGFTSHVKELEPAESEALLTFLYAHSTKPEFTVRYHWHAGDLGFWDNRATQHSVVGDYRDQHRLIQRVTLRGDVPY